VISNQTGGSGVPPLPELEERRTQLYEQIADTGDFRRGSATTNYRRCGKANCACAGAGHPGHGPRHLWTRSEPGGKTKGRQLAPGPEVDKVNREIANYKNFMAQIDQIVEVNEAICEARPILPLADDEQSDVGPDAEKGGSSRRSRRSSPPR
jgi:hypothetical protein